MQPDPAAPHTGAATVTPMLEMRGIKIDPALADPNDIEVLEDLIVAAANDAKAKVEAEVASRMRELTGGIELPPGMKLPF